MIRSIKIQNFRGIREGGLSDLAPMTLLMGPNNSGKSTCLEAACIPWDPVPVDGADMVLRRRGWLGLEELDFAIAAAGTTLAVSGTRAPDERQIESSIKLSLRNVSLSEASDAVGAVGLQGSMRACQLSHSLHIGNVQHSGLVHLLVFDEHGKSCRLHGSAPAQRSDATTSTFLDARVQSDSLADSLSRADSAGEEAHDRLLGYLRQVEEPECYQHTRSLEQLTRILWDTVEAGNQVIASTHSLELLDMLCQEALNREKGLEKVALFRLALTEGALRAVRVPGPDIMMLRNDLQEDLRR